MHHIPMVKPKSVLVILRLDFCPSETMVDTLVVVGHAMKLCNITVSL